MKFFSRLLSSLAIGALLVTGALAKSPDSSQTAFKTVENLFALVRSEFIREVPPSSLVVGAFKELGESLVKKGIPFKAPAVPKDLTVEQAEVLLGKEFHALAAAHPETMKENWLAHEVIDGMIKSLNDRYTVFMDPKAYLSLKESMSGGNFGGVGIYIELDKKNANRLTVAQPIPDSPATDAGLKDGDVILAVDGQSTLGFTINDAQDKLRGPVGSPVTLTIRRINQAKPFDVTLKRDVIHVDSVTSDLKIIDGHKVGYIRLGVFGEATDVELERALRDLEDKGAEGYLLDLRNNGGGYIVTAVDVVSKFVPTGSVVTSVEERGVGNKVYYSRPSLRRSMPLVLLINQYSASASEITAAALSDHKAAELVGVKSFGKGSVQKIFSLPDGSGVKITTAHYHTPTGKDINEVGIEPQVKVAYEGGIAASKDDAQYEAAAKALLVKIGQSDTMAAKFAYPVMRTGSDQWHYLRGLGRGEPRLIERYYVLSPGGDVFTEVVTVRFPGVTQPETFRFDLGPSLGLSS